MLGRHGLLIMMLSIFALSGCATINGAPVRPLRSEGALAQLDCDYAKTLEVYYTKVGQDRKNCRNYFIEKSMGVIDAEYIDFRQRLYDEGVLSPFMTDVATLGLNAAGALTPVAATKSILAAAAAGLTGMRVSAQKNFYFERTIAALLTQMEALRKTVRLRILNGMTASTDVYPLCQAKADLDDYYMAGTVAGAIIGINKDAQKAETTANKAIENSVQIRQRLEKEGFTVLSYTNDEITKILEDFIMPNGQMNKDNEEILKEWLQNNHIATNDVPTFVFSSKYAAEKRLAVAFLKQKGYLPNEN